MLCTNCCKAINPVVALDIDGTMGDFHTHFLKFAVQYLKGTVPTSVPVDEYDGSVQMRNWFCHRFRVTEDVWRDIKLAYRQSGLKRSMPVRTWAAPLTYNLRDLGVEVWVTTTRPYLRMDNIDPDTRFWLDNNHINFDHLLYDEDKYGQLMARVGIGRVVAVLDDLPEDIRRAANLFGLEACLLYRAQHNQSFWESFPHRQIVHEGRTVTTEITRRVSEWRTSARAA